SGGGAGVAGDGTATAGTACGACPSPASPVPRAAQPDSASANTKNATVRNDRRAASAVEPVMTIAQNPGRGCGSAGLRPRRGGRLRAQHLDIACDLAAALDLEPAVPDGARHAPRR